MTATNIRSFSALFTSVLTHILNRVHKWEDLGKMRTFVKQTEIKQGLDESYRELKACSMRFNVRSFFFFQFARLYVPVCADVTTTSGYIDHFAFGSK
jgi:hypothetical protein